jgi:hypothetical protein
VFFNTDLFVPKGLKMLLTRLNNLLLSSLAGLCLIFLLRWATELMSHTRNYDHLSALWQYEGWLPLDVASLARAHYAAYMVRRQDGLRVISLNTNLCTSKFSIVSILSGRGESETLIYSHQGISPCSFVFLLPKWSQR